MNSLPQADEATPYSEQIAALVETHLGQGHSQFSISPLLVALGCSTIAFDGKALLVERHPQPAAGCEDLVRKTLRDALLQYCVSDGRRQHPSDGFSLISGLCTGERWRECLTTSDGAYSFAMLCVELCHESETYPQVGVLYHEASRICAVLNDWLSPTERFTSWPTTTRLLKSLFGEAWYEFEVILADHSNWFTPRLIYRDRPMFVPGLLALQENIAADPLPIFGSGR